MSQDAVLKKLDKVLENFLRSYAVKMLDRLKTADRLNRLREITFSNKSQYAHPDNRIKAIEAWLIENGPLISRNNLTGEMILQITECVEQIGAYSRGELDSFQGKTVLFDRKKASEVAGLANRFLNKTTERHKADEGLNVKLTRGPEINLEVPYGGNPEGDDSKARFLDSLKYQMEVLEYYGDSKYHLFSIVENLLNNISKNPDIKANHMAASILYFLKQSGYKVAPYVERLRKASGNNVGR